MEENGGDSNWKEGFSNRQWWSTLQIFSLKFSRIKGSNDI
jgi:hypothetical protein